MIKSCRWTVFFDSDAFLTDWRWSLDEMRLRWRMQCVGLFVSIGLIVQRRRLAAHGARSQHARSARAHAQLDQHGLLDRAADARRYSGGRGSAAVHDRRPCDGSGRFADPCRSQNALTGLTTGRTRCVRRAMCARTHRLSNTPSASSSGPSCKSGRNSSSPRAATPTGSGGSTGAASGESCVRHLCVMLTGA